MIRRIPSLLVRNASVALLLMSCLLLCGTAWAAPGGPWASLDDIADKTFGVISGTIYDGFVATRFPKARIMRFSGTSDMVLALKAEKVDATLYKDTEYFEAAKRAQSYMIEGGRKGYPPEKVGEVVWDALTTPRPRVRYAVMPDNILVQWLRTLLPKRLIDRIIAANLGFKPRKDLGKSL